ncbi:MAG: hypothetical protein HQM08_28265 [Candidatus Riflebacteria bacterium]|nr:hypothetical protein [Candidatus Riflebacteria bacterium]
MMNINEIALQERLFGAVFHECVLDFFSTDSENYWLLRLQHQQHGKVSFLLTLKNFAAWCTGLKQCIETAKNRSQYPGVVVMTNIIANDLPTDFSDRGAISIYALWEDIPNIQFIFYPDPKNRKSRITLIYLLDDANELLELFVKAYENK